MPSILEEAEELRDKVTELAEKKNRLEGQELELLSQLKDNFGVETVEQAQAKQSRLEKQMERKERMVQGAINELKDLLGIGDD